MKRMRVGELMNHYAFEGMKAEKVLEALEQNYADEITILQLQYHVEKCQTLNTLYKNIHRYNSFAKE